MMTDTKPVPAEAQQAPEVQTPQDATHPHELPWGALLLTIVFLLLITALWVQVYFDLLNRGVF
jgi:cytoskeletal protein RodZ